MVGRSQRHEAIHRMPSFFSRSKKDKGGAKSKKNNLYKGDDANDQPTQQRWEDAWTRKSVEPEEVQELIRGCTVELKSRGSYDKPIQSDLYFRITTITKHNRRLCNVPYYFRYVTPANLFCPLPAGLDMPFLLLPFRPTSNPSAARSFIRSFCNSPWDRGEQLSGHALAQELRLTDPMVLCSVLKWCWSRLGGGVVTWEAYELFRQGEQGKYSTISPIACSDHMQRFEYGSRFLRDVHTPEYRLGRTNQDHLRLLRFTFCHCCAWQIKRAWRTKIIKISRMVGF